MFSVFHLNGLIKFEWSNIMFYQLSEQNFLFFIFLPEIPNFLFQFFFYSQFCVVLFDIYISLEM